MWMSFPFITTFYHPSFFHYFLTSTKETFLVLSLFIHPSATTLTPPSASPSCHTNTIRWSLLWLITVFSFIHQTHIDFCRFLHKECFIILSVFVISFSIKNSHYKLVHRLCFIVSFPTTPKNFTFCVFCLPWSLVFIFSRELLFSMWFFAWLLV